ncbi:hypothetical protein CKF54_03225 [Psittacicella hinzii]|uniref:Glycerol-3-phosphate acyltransferase n=1 Tax=Psittacicella hinzii TaxID=2028575 RepID=A0A3A1YAS0_9GAMM|nr:1-acyl-sn-glycerol-3-phosphate acyltransferase [Psittacicella hinzii]RIY33217.1 hypothetical protein CKF54_03225 [Psittacicella hinzii]
MSSFLFKLTRLRSIVKEDIAHNLTPEQKVIYILPYDSSLALEALAATVKNNNLPWDKNLISHQGYGKFNNAPVIFIQKGGYLTAEKNPLHPQLKNDLVKLFAQEDLVFVMAYPQWGTNIITKPSVEPNASALTKAWYSLTSFLNFRKFFYLTLYAKQPLADLINIMLSSETSTNLEVLHEIAQELNEGTNLTSLSSEQQKIIAHSLANHLYSKYQDILARRNSNKPVIKRKNLITSVISDPQVQEALSKGKKEGKNSSVKDTVSAVAQQQKQAYALIEEIAADPKFRTLKSYDFVLEKLWNRFYSGISIRGLDNLLEILYKQDNVSLTYVSTHRSHIDYLLLSYLLNNYGAIKTPLIAAGINLNFWPVGKIFRRGGAFFLRRSFNNYLYAVVFKTYIAELLKNNQDTEFFIEGGRSRTGRLLVPKTGMLNMMLNGYLKNREINQYYVPIFLAYDKVFESKTYVQELLGKSKDKESALLVLRNLSKLKYQGQVHVNFAPPLAVRSYLQEYWPSWQEDLENNEINKVGFEATSNALARDIAISINSNASISAKALFSAAIFNTDGKYDREQLHQDIDFIRSVMQQTITFNPGYAVCDTASDELVTDILKVCHKNIQVKDNQLEISAEALAEFNYYRNNVEHCFIAPSLAAIKLEKNIDDENLKGFCHYFSEIFNLNSFTNFTEQTLFNQVKHFESILSENTSEQRQILAKQLYTYLVQIDTFISTMVEALNKLSQEAKGIEHLQLSTISPQVIAKLKEQKSIYPDFADKTTINQLRNAFATANTFSNITPDQLVEALSHVHVWLK